MEHYCRHCKTLLSEHKNSDAVECSYCIGMFIEIQQGQGLQNQLIEPHPYKACDNCGKYPDGSVSYEASLQILRWEINGR